MLLLLTLWVFTPTKKELVETHSLLPFIFTLSWTRISISCVGHLHNQIDKRVILIASSVFPSPLTCFLEEYEIVFFST